MSDDAISRQAAIDAINHICPVDTEYDCALLDRVDVRCVLLDLPSAQQWIPISERLPEENTDVLVTYVNGEETRIIPVNYARGIWFDCIFDTKLDPLKITAWMPLPKPWRGEWE